MVIRLEFVPTGILILVCVGPIPRRTMPVLISRRLRSLKSPADSCTPCPPGQAWSAAWMAAVASAVPLPKVEALTLAQTVVRAGIPPGIPGFQVVMRSAGSAYIPPTGGGTVDEGSGTGVGVMKGVAVTNGVAVTVGTGVGLAATVVVTE